MSLDVPVLTIDGLSGSGKSTVGRVLAEKLGWHFLDSGTTYRMIARCLLLAGLRPEEREKVIDQALKLQAEVNKDECGALQVEIRGAEQYDMHIDLRDELISRYTSMIATYAEIRSLAQRWQRLLRQFPGLVAEGRDMGTRVFPDARWKVVLQASEQARVDRRIAQLSLAASIPQTAAERSRLKPDSLQGSAKDAMIMSKVAQNMRERDQRDQSRSIDAFTAPVGSVTIDNSDLSVDQTVQRVIELMADQSDP